MSMNGENDACHFSTACPLLLRERMPGSEALMEEWLRRTPDEELESLVFLLHDWAVNNRDSGFYHLGKYFNQDRPEIEKATDLFRTHRSWICNPARKAPGSYVMLQLFLLYDCLVHVGSIVRGERTMGFLEDPMRGPDCYDVAEIVNNPERHGRVYNYVVVNGMLRIAKKAFYHSETAHARPVTGSGEIAAVRHGGRVSLMINNRSGHYRPLYSSLYDIIDKIRADLNGSGMPEKRQPSVIMSAEYLFNQVKKLMPEARQAEAAA